jgi:hypothetical protein
MTALVVVEGIVIALLVVLVAGLLRSHAEVLRRLHALDGGEEGGHRADGLQVTRSAPEAAPDAIAGTTPDGATSMVALRGSRGFTLLAFLSSGCTTCRPFWEAFDAGVEMPAPEVRPVVVTKGPHEESPSRIAELAPRQVPVLMSSDAWEAFRIPVSPYFVLVDAATGGVVGEGAAGSWDGVRNLLAQAMADTGITGGRRAGKRRADRIEEQLHDAGIEPGDPSLFRNPHGEGS